MPEAMLIGVFILAGCVALAHLIVRPKTPLEIVMDQVAAMPPPVSAQEMSQRAQIQAEGAKGCGTPQRCTCGVGPNFNAACPNFNAACPVHGAFNL